jgi:hypothetical protein
MNVKPIRRNSPMLLATWSIAVVISASIVAAAEKIEPQPISGKISWVYDYQEGQRASWDTGKPMFVVFRCER